MSAPATTAQPQSGTLPRPAVQSTPAPYRRLRWQLAAAALAVAASCLWVSPVPAGGWPDVLLLTTLAAVLGLLPTSLPGKGLTMFPNIPLFFALAGLRGATAALVAVVASTIISCLVTVAPKNRLRLNFYLPAVSAQVIAFAGSALLYAVLEKARFPGGGVRPGEATEWRCWLALPVCALLAFVLAAIISTTQASRFSGQRWDILWHDNFRWLLPSGLLLSPVGFLTAVLYAQHWWLGVGFIILPVYTLRTSVVAHERTMAAYKQGVELLGRVMQEAHPYTHGHLHRVAHWAKRIAEEMNLPASSMQHIEDAAILHDIGKVAVDDRVLNKVGKLSDDDWAMIRRHPVTGSDLVIQMSVLGRVGHWIRHHHERPDGKGYPDHLEGDQIPIESAIISVVDAYDAMVGGPAKEDQRPYRQPMTPDAAMEELRRHAGTQFHERVVDVFIAILRREQDLEATGGLTASEPDLVDDSLWAAPPELSGTLSLSGGS